jgi:two-component system sensor histidine kinase AtoS
MLKIMMIPENVQTKIDIPDELVYLLDMKGMARVLTNLFTNSLEAMPQGGILGICAYDDDGGLVIEVSDTGVGIKDEHRDKIFTPFFTTKATGVGLGLAYVMETVEAHGGNVRYTSAQDQGSTFIIRIPSE